MSDGGTRHPEATDDAFDLAACALLTLSPVGLVERANRAAGAWTGYAPAGLVGKRLSDLLTIGSKLFVQTHWLPLMEMQGSVAELQIELAQRDGGKLPALMNAARRADRRIDIAFFTTVDRRKYERELLRARRHAEELIEALRQREDEFRTIAENSPDILTRFDRDGRITYVSPAVRAITGRSAESFVGTRFEDDALVAESHLMIAGLARALAGEAHAETFDYVTDDGKALHLDVRFVPERGADGTVTSVLGITRDVTALRERQRDTEQRARFAEQLVGIVSHDLRNPLNAILLGAQLLADEDLGPNARIVQRITSAANRASRLTSELLDFTQSRLGEGLSVTPSEVALHSVVSESLDELRLAWPGRPLEHEKTGSGTGLVDADRLAQVVTNLVGNAMTYGDPTRSVRVRSIVDDRTLVLEVHNMGRPIPNELQREIFEPLRRGDEQVRRGSRSVGLGLYIVREIAHAHGGEVTVASSADHGTTFRVELPRRR